MKPHARLCDVHNAVTGVSQTDPGEHNVLASGKQLEHANRVCTIHRLGENPAVDHHRRIGSQHDVVPTGLNGEGLVAGDALHVVLWRLGVTNCLIHIGRAHHKRETRLA